MNWRILRAFPKLAIAASVLVISTGLFAVWWLSRTTSEPSLEYRALPEPRFQVQAQRPSPAQVEKQKKAAKLPEKMGWLALVGPDLYDISTGELLFPNWLRGIPERLFYQKENNRLMALTERGVIRFALDGTPDGVMGENAVPAFTHDGKLAIYVKNGDVWIADTDWRAFLLTNERQVTKIGQFNASFFAANVVMGTDKAIVVKHQARPLRINLLTGDVQPINLPLGDLAKRRSPDGRFLVGDESRNIYAFDVESAEAYNFPTGSRERLVDYQWLTNERCAFIVGGKGVGLYDRTKNKIEEVCALPFPCNKMAGPSPDGRFVLCAARQGIVIVDTKQKTTEAFGTSAQDFGWVSNDTLIYARDVPDTNVRGTWLLTMGGQEKLVTAEPYSVGRDGSGAVALMSELGEVVFGTGTALFRMKPDGSDLREVTKLVTPATKVQAVEIFGN